MSDVRSGRVGQQPGVQPTLQQKEQGQVRDRGAQQARQRDSARLAQQAGFARGAQAKKRGFDIGDSMRAPIPLPDEEEQEEQKPGAEEEQVWSQERLQQAQQNMILADTRFGQVQKELGEGESPSLAEGVLGNSYAPTEEDVEKLQVIADREPAPPPGMQEAQGHMASLFGVALHEDTPPGHKLLAAGLVVAGESGAVNVGQGGDGKALDEQALSGGLQVVTKRSNQAVNEASKMGKGIRTELHVHRTMIPRR